MRGRIHSLAMQLCVVASVAGSHSVAEQSIFRRPTHSSLTWHVAVQRLSLVLEVIHGQVVALQLGLVNDAAPVVPPYMAIVSLMVDARAPVRGMAMCPRPWSLDGVVAHHVDGRGVAHVLGRRALDPAGHGGREEQVWRSGCVHAPRMISMSSANPMSTIWSASSSTANLQRVTRSRVPFSRWSLSRPGVPTTTSTPLRRAVNCGGYGVPP